MEAGTIVALIFGGLGWVLAVIQTIQRHQEVRANQLLDALGYLTGKTQARNVGIAILQGLAPRSRQFRGAVVPLLANQAIYLLEESGEGSKAHEVENLRRIMNLATGLSTGKDFVGRPYASESIRSSLRELRHSVDRKLDGRTAAGLTVDTDQLQAWHQALEQF